MIEKVKVKINWVKSHYFQAGLALFIISFLFFYDLFGERYLLTERDLAPYFIPPRFFWVESLRHWEFPLWNPYQFAGQPFFANPQHAILYPLNGLFLFLPFDLAFNVVIVLHFFLAGLFTYLFMKDLKVSSAGSLISGLIWMLGGYLLSVHSLLTILLSVIWTPLVMLFFRRALIHPGIKNEMITSIFITLSFLGGGIEIVYGNFFVLLIMMMFAMNRSILGESLLIAQKGIIPAPHQSAGLTPVGIEESNGIPRIPWSGLIDKYGAGLIKSGMTSCLELIPLSIIRFRTFFIISILFIFLSAIQLLPFLELWVHSIRGQGITYQEATVWSFAPKDVLLFFLPDAYGYFLDMKKYWISQCWLKTMYTGGLPFILSLLFFLVPRGEQGNPKEFGKSRFFFLSLMFFSLFFSLGQYNPIYPFVYQYVPFLNGIRYPVKFLYIFILCLAITAGLGFERLRQFSKERDNKIFKHLLMGFALLSGISLLFLVLGHGQIEPFLKTRGIDYPQFNHLPANLFHAKRFLFYLTLFFLLLRVGYEVKWKGWAKASLIFFLIADLFGNMGFYGKEKTEDYFRKTKIAEMISSEKGPFRVFSTAKTISFNTPILIGNVVPFDLVKEKHLPSLNMINHLHDIWGVDVVRLKKNDDLYKEFINLPSISSSRLVDVYGIKHVISVTPLEEDPRFELIYARLEGLEGKKEELLKKETVKLYRVKDSSQRAQIVKNFKVMDSKEILSAMVGKDFQPDREVFLEEEPRWNKINSTRPPVVNGEGKKSVKFILETNNRLALQVQTDEDSILVLSDTHYPGWKAFVDGREEKILRANYHFRAVTLNRGSSRVEFVYDPFSFKMGVLLTFLGILGCLVGWAIHCNFRVCKP